MTGPALAGGLLSGHAHFLDWGVVQISLTNFVIIIVMVVLFVLALVVPFPRGHAPARTTGTDTTGTDTTGTDTTALEDSRAGR